MFRNRKRDRKTHKKITYIRRVGREDVLPVDYWEKSEEK
jgi:hypothetical protein